MLLIIMRTYDFKIEGVFLELAVVPVSSACWVVLNSLLFVYAVDVGEL